MSVVVFVFLRETNRLRTAEGVARMMDPRPIVQKVTELALLLGKYVLLSILSPVSLVPGNVYSLQLPHIKLDKLLGWQSVRSIHLWRTSWKKCMFWNIYLYLLNLGTGSCTSQMQ